MIKKIIFVLTILIALMASLLSYTSITLIDDCYIGAIPDYVTILEDKEVLYFYLDFSGDMNQSIDEVLKYCQSHKQTMMMISSQNDAGVNYVHWYFYSHDIHDLEELKIVKQHDIDFSKYDKNLYYSTAKEDKNSLGQLVTIDRHYYDDAPHQYVLHNMNGIHEVIKKNDNKIAMQLYTDNKKALLEDMISLFNKNKIGFQDATDNYSPAQIETVRHGKIEKLLTLFVLAVCLVVLLLIIDVLKLKRTIMIKRLNGISVFRILLEQYDLFFIEETIVFVVSLLMAMYFKTGKFSIYNANYYELLGSYLIIFIAAMMVFGFVMYLFIHLTTHLKYLKSKYQIKNFVEINMLLKIAVICLLISPIMSLVLNIKDSMMTYLVFQDNKEEIGQLAYVDGNLNSVSKTYEVFDYLMQHGGIYVDFQTYAYNTTDYLKKELDGVSDEEIAEMAIDYPFIFANANYLDEYPIKDENGKVIDLYQYSEDVILVPKKYKNEDVKKIMFGRNLEVIFIQNTDEYVNYHLSQPYYLSNPVIRLITHKTDDTQMSHMYLNIKNKSIKDYQNELSKFTDNSINIIKNKSMIDYLIRNLRNDIQEALFSLGIYMIFMIIFIYQSTYLYLNEKQMYLSIQYMHGLSFKERYQELIVYTFFTYIIVLLIGVVLLKLFFGTLLLLSMMSLLFELLIQFLLIKRFENQSIVHVLKGEID